MEDKSFAYELLQDSKKQNKRLFIIVLVLIAVLFVETTYLVYVLNDIGVVEDSTEVIQQDANTNNYIGNDGTINNGNSNN